jgi:hypothetical protein
MPARIAIHARRALRRRRSCRAFGPPSSQRHPDVPRYRPGSRRPDCGIKVLAARTFCKVSRLSVSVWTGAGRQYVVAMTLRYEA